MNLPMEFTSRMKSLLGNEYDTFIQSYTASAVRALRTNTLKCTPDALIGSLDFKTAPLSFTENGFTFTEDKIGASPAHHAGMFYAQDPSAMAVLAGVTLPFDRPIRALDLCAAPGGKTSQLAAMLPKGSFLVANEIVRCVCERHNILITNLFLAHAVQNIGKGFNETSEFLITEGFRSYVYFEDRKPHEIEFK